MLSHLTTGAWWTIATFVTVVYLAAMHWTMPTPKARRRMFLAPAAGWIFLLPQAVIKGYSVPETLYVYSTVLVTFVVALTPVAKRVGADIAEQERNPWRKVPLNTFSLYWCLGALAVCGTAAICFWPSSG
ncbi:hypothetical protein [Streptomyces sp. NBC_00102]|uniref:hypothetical protein n=1 Tax=Streptomyces sp. NBC_00102 TaxID=2975652 RepID=UPI00224CF6D0|nr:hypothetical protein [Streptomyces sp. NBC_00102]MCX5399099.1 hypothetical protein [Streptomyces sp. NBC_00102]